MQSAEQYSSRIDSPRLGCLAIKEAEKRSGHVILVANAFAQSGGSHDGG